MISEIKLYEYIKREFNCAHEVEKGGEFNSK